MESDAIAVIGGLTVSTILTLVLIPTLYCVFAGTGIKRNRKKMKAARELNDYYQAHKTEMTKGKKRIINIFVIRIEMNRGPDDRNLK